MTTLGATASPGRRLNLKKLQTESKTALKKEEKGSRPCVFIMN